MSSDQEFLIKIKDFIGKAWLASLDDSEGYILSFKLIEQNNSTPVSPETEQEEIENNLRNIPSSENLNQSTNRESIIESQEESKAIEIELCSEFSRYLQTPEDCQYFVEEINNNNNNLINSDILPIRYEELIGEVLSHKMIYLIDYFQERNKIKQLKEVYYIFKESNNL